MQTNPSNRILTSALLALMCLGLLVAGCGKQDLYEPPGSPYEIVSHLTLPSANEGLAVMGRTVYVAGGEAGLHTIDWTDPANPVLLATINTTKFAEDIQVVRTFDGGVMRDIAHVVEGTEGVTSYDVTDPAAPIDYLMGTTAVVGRTIFIEQDADPSLPYSVYLAEDWKGVRLFESETGDPGRLTYDGVFLNTNGKAYGLVVRDGWGYCADNEMGLCVLDLRIRDLDHVSLTSWSDTPGSARFVALQDDYAFVADGVEGLAVFRINEGDTPQKITQYDLSGFSESIDLRDGLMVLAGNLGGVHFFDVNDPEHPVYLGSTPIPNATDVVFSDDGYCLVMCEETGLWILGGRGPFSDQSAPSPISDLVADPTGVDNIDLIFTMTGDDRMQGTAAALDIRWSATPIEDQAAWDTATPVTGLPEVEAPGTRMVVNVSGLERATEYHFAARVQDSDGQWSVLSDDAGTTTLDEIVLRDGAVDIEGGSVLDTYTYEVEVLWGLDVALAEVIIDDEARVMTQAADRVWRYQTQLEPGLHDYRFRFAADSSPDALYPTSGDAITGPVVGTVFTMGSAPGEPGRVEDEVQHIVALSHFLIAEDHEVTQAEWDAVMPAESNPSRYVGSDRPVDSVTWYEAVAYCNALSLADGYDAVYTIDGTSVTADHEADGWRLPTEAEWEYLCRAGSQTGLPGGDLVEMNCRLDTNLDAVGWYCGNATSGPAVGRQKQANAFDLYDMNGNLREWCWDWYGELSDDVAIDPTGPATGARRLCRGGSWYGIAQDCRAAARGALPPDSSDDTVGFRVVRNDPSR